MIESLIGLVSGIVTGTRDWSIMIEIFTGVISGIVSGLGMGGGTILILLLTLIIGTNQHEAQATNLIFFIPTSISAIIINLKQKIIDLKLSIIIIISGIIGATIGAITSSNLNVKILKKAFGVFLLLISIYETYQWYITYIKRKKEHNKY